MGRRIWDMTGPEMGGTGEWIVEAKRGIKSLAYGHGAIESR
jgi:hypothetical protein